MPKVEKVEAWSDAFDTILKEVLPYEIGKLHRKGYDVYGLCVCMLSMLDDEEGKAKCGKWEVEKQGKDVFVCRFKQEKK